MTLTAPFAGFVALLGGVALLRLAEVALSVARIRRRPTAAVGEGWGFASMVVLHVAAIVTPIIEVVVAGRPFRWSVAGPALVVFAAAGVLRVWMLRTLRGAWNVRVVPPRQGALAFDGPYRWIRHPNYLCVILELAALPLVHGAWVSAVGLTLLNGLVLTRRIRIEERELARFESWRTAMDRVPRLIPRRPRR